MKLGEDSNIVKIRKVTTFKNHLQNLRANTIYLQIIGWDSCLGFVFSTSGHWAVKVPLVHASMLT